MRNRHRQYVCVNTRCVCVSGTPLPLGRRTLSSLRATCGCVSVCECEFVAGLGRVDGAEKGPESAPALRATPTWAPGDTPTPHWEEERAWSGEEEGDTDELLF